MYTTSMRINKIKIKAGLVYLEDNKNTVEKTNKLSNLI